LSVAHPTARSHDSSADPPRNSGIHATWVSSPAETCSEREPKRQAPGAQPRLIADNRLISLDTFRGLVMVLLIFDGFHLYQTSRNFPDSRLWQTLGAQFEHSEWSGCTLWDLILPSFMFIVGVSMAFSYGRRRELGQSWSKMFRHALFRSVVLVVLGVFLFRMTLPIISGLLNVLAQIGLGYVLVFLLWSRPAWVQALTAGIVLLATWVAYGFYATSGISSDTTALLWWTADPSAWAQAHLSGLAPQWHANANFGAAADAWLFEVLNAGGSDFRPGLGGYQVVAFIPASVMMIFGLMAGELLRTNRSQGRKVATLALAGAAGLGAGWILHVGGVCPLIKKIYTPSFALFATGWCLLLLAAIHALTVAVGWRRWTWPLVIVGLNSIVMYCLYMLVRPFTAEACRRFLGPDVFLSLGERYAPTVEAVLVGATFWLVALWLYRQRIFIRI
jgi:heparan-alpha-glucosaminide N-acetyltransferase